MINNLSTQTNWINRNKPYVPNSELFEVLVKVYNVENNLFSDLILKRNSLFPTNINSKPTSAHIQLRSITQTPSDAAKHTQIQQDKSWKKPQINEPVILDKKVHNSIESRTPLKSKSDNVRNLESQGPAKRQKPSFNASSNRNIIAQQEHTIALRENTNLDLYKKYIKLLNMKTNLLTQRYLTFESSSISLDDKHKFIENEFKVKLDHIETNLANLNDILPIDLAEIDENVEPITTIEHTIPDLISVDNLARKTDLSKELIEPDIDPFEEFDRESAVTSFKTNLVSNIQEIQEVSEVSDNELDLILPHIFQPPRPSNPLNYGLRNVPQPTTPEEVEDEFGEGEMEGLLTPTQERDNDKTDLSGFIDDSELIDLSEQEYSFGYSDAETIHDSITSLSDDIVVDKQELDDLKMSQDIMEPSRLDYEDFDLSQINDEREVNVIEIGDYSDYDYDVDPVFIKPEPAANPIPLDSDIFSDDDTELGITTSTDIINEHLKTYPGNEQLIKQIYQTLNVVFGLRNFRSNQFEAIINFLMGRDVFVLMPTGGGKSLCYQLPALVKHLNQGITIVISPLISLMQDQINHLVAKDIKAGMISSKNTPEERRQMLDLFRHAKLDLVYLSPEMINASGNIQRIIQHLYDHDLLGKIVVDEAHCISSWGHDFRPDYKGMNYFKNNFPKLPIMALTATANEKVKMDIIHNLNMANPKILKQSFNRINLFYEIKWKTSNYIDDIRDLINAKYRDKTGIIYCHSKQLCEQISGKLNSHGLNTSFYHAGMSTQDRFQVQNDWQREKIRIICATIAFGMGIDKPNVRFVIHLFLPRNLEGYYQETGRAGRDGLKSQCIMYYSYKDARNLKLMIQRDLELNQVTKDNHVLKLRQVVQYCENINDCRRKQVLQYFNENFNPKECDGNCDNCRNNNGVQVEKNITDISQQILKMVGEIERQQVTLLYCQDVFKGSNAAKIISKGHNQLAYHGMGKKLDRLELERIFFHLISEDCLVEYSVMKGGFASNYVKLGKNASRVLGGNLQMHIKFNPKVKNTNGSVNESPNLGNGQATATANKIGFVNAKTNQPIILPPNPLAQYVTPENNDHVEKSYRELNYIRNYHKGILKYQDANSILSNESLKEISIFLPVTREGFKRYTNNADQLTYFIYFKKKLIELHNERFGTNIAVANGPNESSQRSQKQRRVSKGPRGGISKAKPKKNRQRAMPL